MKTKSKKILKTALMVFCVVFGLLAVLSASLLVMFTLPPCRYQPVQSEGDRKVSTYLTHYLAPEIYNNIQFDDPFELAVSEQGLNDVIAGDGWLHWLDGTSVSDPAVVFTQGRVVLMAKAHFGPVRPVLAVMIEPDLNGTGRLVLNLRTIKAGIIDITPIARDMAGRIVAGQLEKNHEDNWLKVISDAFLSDEPVEPVFTVRDRRIRLTRIRLLEGELILTLQPE